MIRAVIFDCFGVLTTEALTAFVEANIQRSDLERVYDLEKAVNAGFIPRSEFIQGLASAAHKTVDDVEEMLTVVHQPNAQLFEYIAEHLKPSYKIGLLSNASHNVLPALFSLKQRALFDDVVLSVDVRLAKPDPAIFVLAAERLGVLPDECIFIDDQERYCSGARQVGMQTVVYTTARQAINEITMKTSA